MMLSPFVLGFTHTTAMHVMVGTGFVVAFLAALATGRASRHGWLFATPSASCSIVSSAIFWASSMSPRTSPPVGMRYEAR
jgi:hypothetical protein